MATGVPPTVAPFTWSWASVPSALPPAFSIRAYLAPENDCASKVAKGPPQVVSTPILIAPAGASAGAAAVSDDLEDELPPPPQAASTSIAALATATTAPRPLSRLLEFLIDSPAPWRWSGVRRPHRIPTDNRLAINAD